MRKTIIVAAAIILNDQDQLLLVRKANTHFFMQVGGKLEIDEAPEQTMLREIAEEIGVEAKIVQDLGRFETQAANEAGHQLLAYVYHVKIEAEPKIAAEIAEMKWMDLHDQTTALAPLTRDVVIPWCQRYLQGEAV